MSKAAKQSILILVILLCAATVFSAITANQKASLIKEKVTLQNETEGYRTREVKYLTENKDLKKKVQDIEKAKKDLEEKLSSLDQDLPSLEKKIADLTKERDQWKTRLDSLQKEREDLIAKLAQKPKEKIVYKYVEKEPTAEEAAAKAKGTVDPVAATALSAMKEGEEESYWAEILKQKVALEMEIEKLKENLTANAVEVVEMKKQNSDLQLELSKMVDERETIEREIKHGKDLANNLALELARAKNDKKFLNDRLDKLDGENSTLRNQIRQLASTKIALEKSIVRLQEDKKETEKKLLQTENVIQSRIDEIWKIKDSLDKEFQPTAQNEGSREIELPPIVVSAADSSSDDKSREEEGLQSPGFDGSIVSVNDDNNFVIVDVGEIDGILLGDNLSVYRGPEYIAGLEVIQVRKDIAAADIKNKVAKIQVGDTVR